jgi:hypothetical protein
LPVLPYGDCDFLSPPAALFLTDRETPCRRGLFYYRELI